MLSQSKLSILSIAFTFSLVACGGGGGGDGASITGPSYTGVTTPSAVNSTNAEELALAATDAAAQIVSAENATNANPIIGGVVITNSSDTVPTSDFVKLTADIAKQAVAHSQTQTVLPVGYTISAAELNDQEGTDVYCGGSVSIPDDTNFAGSTIDLTMTFTDFCYNDGMNPQTELNGALRLIESDTSVSIIYSNFTMASGGETYTINASATCDAMGSSCDVDFVGSDGTTYRMGDLSVSGNDLSGYLVSGTFYHPDYGSISMSTTEAVTFVCASAPQPNTGKLAFTGDGGTSGSILFQGCSGYTLCYDEGVGEICASGTW